MNHKLIFSSASAIGMLALGGCVYGPYGYPGAHESIWTESAPRYGYRAKPRPPVAERFADATPPRPPRPYRPSPTEPYNTYTGENRYGANSGRASGAQYDPGDPPRLSGTVSGARREQEMARERYEREVENPAPPAGGFRPATTEPREDELASVPPAPGPAPADEPEMEVPPANSGANTGGAAADTYDNLPFAVPVPGKAGYVNLPAPHTGLPEIDVRGIEPGTPVEIPDPNNAGATIQFRVP